MNLRVSISTIALLLALANRTAAADPTGIPTIYHSPILDHAVPRTIDGTSLNLVTGELDDSGPLSGDWDINFWSSSGTFSIEPLDDYAVRVVVDDNGDAAVLQRGDVVGPNSLLAHEANLAAAWLDGVDGYLGVEFVCGGRLANPPNDQVCYGYIHVTSGGNNGFPAMIVQYSFDVVGFEIVIDDEPSCWIKTETIFCDGFNAVGIRATRSGGSAR